MSDLRHRLRRTLPVVILDAVLAVFTALSTGHLPWARRAARDEPDGEGPRVRRSTVIGLATAGAVVTAGTVTLVLSFLQSPDGLAPLGVASPPPPAALEQPPPGSAGPSPTPAGGVAGLGSSPAAVPGTTAGVTMPPPPGPPTTPAGSPVPLTARYAAEGVPGLLGYRATVTVTNPGPTAAGGWTVTLTLPRTTLTVTDVSGAKARQDGATWTFTPQDGAPAVPPSGSVQLAFHVRGATLVSAKPTGCTINGRPCEGLPD
jgi:hypothetical protein